MSSHKVKRRNLGDGKEVVTKRDRDERPGSAPVPPTASSPTRIALPPRLPPQQATSHLFATSPFVPTQYFGQSSTSSQAPRPAPFGSSPYATTPYFGQSSTSGQAPRPAPFGSSPYASAPYFGQPSTSGQAPRPDPFGSSPYGPTQHFRHSSPSNRTSDPAPTNSLFGFSSLHNSGTTSSPFQPPLSVPRLSPPPQALPSIPTPSQPSQSLSFPTLGKTPPVSNGPAPSQTISVSTTQTALQTTQTGLLPPVAVVPTIRFRIGENGKIHYFQREDANTQQTHAGHYVELSGQDFTVFKNAGKRYGSSKITDPQSLQNYVVHSGQFYEFDKTAPNKRGQLAADQTGLLSKQQSGQLVDRSRGDRIGGDLQPFDVGHYQQAPSGSKFDVLSGKSETFGANRDHVVSGESLRRRAKSVGQDEDQAYKQGLTVAIPNDEIHKLHSPTFGGRQKSRDKVGSVQQHRVKHDTEKPALAFYRDTTAVLARTANQNYGSVHPALDLTQPENRIRQVGAYRLLFKASATVNAVNSSRGFDPSSSAYEVTHTPKPKEPHKIGSFTAVTSTSGQSQGTRLAQSLTQNLKDTGKTK